MTAELQEKRCRQCIFGELTPLRELDLGKLTFTDNDGVEQRLPQTRIPLSLMIPPKIKRNCLTTLDRALFRRERIVGFPAECVKPKSYSPRK